MEPSSYRGSYALNILISVAVSLMLCISIVRLWPINARSTPLPPSPSRTAPILESVIPTQQSAVPAPPPPPVVNPPLVLPQTEVLPRATLDLRLPPSSGAPAGDSPKAGPSPDSLSPALAKRPPQPTHFAEPAYPSTALHQGVRAQIVIELLVNHRGKIEKNQIINRYLITAPTANRSVSAACCSKLIMENELASPQHRTSVKHLGHGLEEAALAAAWKWSFQPPQTKKQALASHAILTFTFGR